MKNHFILGLGTLLLLNLGCSSSKFAAAGTSSADALSETNSCMDPLPYSLQAKMTDFEMSSTVGGNFSFLNLISLSFSYSKGQLENSMDLIDTASGESVISVTGVGKYTANNDDISIDIQKYGIGFSYLSQTPIAKLAKASIQNGLTQIDAQLASWGNKWTTSVTSITPNGNLMLGVGARAGLRVGDQFEVYNVTQNWVYGTPCVGAYTVTPTTKTPIAIVEVVPNGIVGDAATLQIDSQVAGTTILPGAAIYVHQLSGKKRAALKLPIRLLPVQGSPLNFVNGQTVDFKSFVQDQFAAIVSADNFYIQNP